MSELEHLDELRSRLFRAMIAYVVAGLLLAVISAGPGTIGAGERFRSHQTWESLTRSTALVNTSWVLYCNRVGWEEGSFYSGGSHIVRPDGEILCRAEGLSEELIVSRIDLREVDRVRWRLPLLQSARNDIEGPG